MWGYRDAVKLAYGYIIDAGDHSVSLGVEYDQGNIQIGYRDKCPLPTHLYVKGTIKLARACFVGGCWGRLAFISRVKRSDGVMGHLEFDVWRSSLSPTHTREHKHQLEVGVSQEFVFDLVEEHRQTHSNHDCSMTTVESYFMFEARTVRGGGWIISYSIDDMGYLVVN